ncbi:MAG: hypothetical protein V1921_06170 [Candidatus Altiarchaeota archaeon]
MSKLLVFAVLLALSTQVWAASLTGIDLSDTSIDPEESFYATADIRSPEPGMELRFYVDDHMFSVKRVGSGTEEVRSSDYSQSEWDKYYIECGKHRVYAQLTRDNKIVDNISTTLNVGNLPLFSLDPERPSTSKPMTIIMKDEDSGDAAASVGVDILYVREGDIYKKESDASGKISFTPPESGRYDLTIGSSREYCGKYTFYAKKDIVIDGPFPKDPVAGELTTIALPSGVGLKGFDSTGKVVFTAYTTIGGGANFTINQPGTYTLSLGDMSSDYWARNVSITIGEKPVPEIRITPEKATVGESILITIISRGSPLSGAVVTITSPDNSFETFTTSTSGEIVYTPAAIGDYTIKAEKSRYTTVEQKFGARNTFKIDMNPAQPNIGSPMNLTIRNQLGATVADVSINFEGGSGVTDSAGFYTFSLTRMEPYNIKVSKARFWEYSIDVTPLGVLKADISASEIELGQGVNIVATDAAGSQLTAEITSRLGEEVSAVEAGTFTPAKPGLYNITVKKDGYNVVSQTLIVKAHPVDIDFKFSGKTLKMTLTSRGYPVRGVTVKLNEKTAISDENGMVVYEIDGIGEYQLEMNRVNVIQDYESKLLIKQIEKRYNFWLLLIPVIMVLTLALATIAILHEGHKKLYLVNDGLRRLGFKTRKEDVIKKSKRSSLSDL